MTDFFKHGNKVYSENLNDGILVGNSFDWTVNMSLPGDTGGVFPNSTTVVKAKVADCSITPNSNLSIGETITNNAGSSQVYRLTVYPNFNRYGGFTFVSLEGDGSVIITEVGASSPIRNNLDYSNLGDVVELKQLKEYDIVVTIPAGGVVTGLSFGFKSSSADVTASISQANVNGLISALSSLESGKADTEHTHSSTDVTEASALSNIGTSANATQAVVNGAVDESVGSLSTSITNIYEASGTMVTNTCFTYRTSLGTFKRVGKVVQFEMTDNVKATNTTTRGATYTYLTIPDGFKPTMNKYMQNMYWLNNEKEHQITFIAQPNGQLNARVWWIQSTQQDVGLMIGATWITNDDYPSQ